MSTLGTLRASRTAASRWPKLPTVPRRVTTPSSHNTATSDGCARRESLSSASRTASWTEALVGMCAPLSLSLCLLDCVVLAGAGMAAVGPPVAQKDLNRRCDRDRQQSPEDPEQRRAGEYGHDRDDRIHPEGLAVYERLDDVVLEPLPDDDERDPHVRRGREIHRHGRHGDDDRSERRADQGYEVEEADDES